MFDNETVAIAEEVRNTFWFLETVIYRNVRLSESLGHGKPILLYDPHSMGAENYS
jgi:chromosome partitioning protein